MGSYFYHYLLGVTLISGISVLCVVTPSLCGAYLPGDIVIGILSSVHSKLSNVYASNRPYTPCEELNLISFVQSLAIIQTIETINNSSFLPGLQLGYLMCDPCACASKALHCVEHMLAVNGSLSVLSDYTNFNSPVKAFLGERYSELSIAVAKMLSLYMIPQISCTSSAPTLSDKLRYPSFLRVIPSDIYQTQALAKLMRHFSWNWVGVVTLDDDYGNAALENFLLAAEEVKVCVEFKQVLPTIDIPEKSIKEAADCIRSSSAKVVLLILRPSLVEMLFKEMIRTNTTRTWIASDAWSMAGLLMKMKDINKVGDILGFTFVTGEIPGFNDYLLNLQPSSGGHNDFIMEYKNMRFKCPPATNSNSTRPPTCNVTDPQVMNDDFLLNVMDLTATYSQRVAVYAVAHAINEILECNETACPGDTNFQTEKLVAILREINFTLDNQTYFFNNNGDFDNGYDLIMWKNTGNGRISSVVGKYLISKRDVEVYEDNIQWTNNTVPWSRCSETCPPGTWKSVSDVSCCYNCTVCSEGFFSNLPDQDTCQKCPNGTTSLPNSTECQEWKVWYLKWSDPYSVVVMVGTGMGVMLLIFSFVFFVLHRDNPIIRDTFKYSCIMKFGLIVSFVGVIIFLGRPSINQCIAQQAMYAFGYTLCVSCILTKAFHTFIAYMACDPNKQHRLQRFDKPCLLIVLLNAIQGLICIFWFVFDPPDVEKIESNTALTMSHLCTQGPSMIAFGAMHTYIAVLALVCFLLAFKGIDKETDVIVFSMIIHLLTWFCFIPVFITQHELRPITQISAIMVSNYGVIFCHFAPKWFKIISEKAENENALHITSSQSIDTVSDSAIGFSINGSVDSFPLPNPVSATISGPADVVNYGWENGLNIGSSVDSIKIPSTELPEQLNIADVEISDLDILNTNISEESIPTMSTISTVSCNTDGGSRYWDNGLNKADLEDSAITAIMNRAQITTALVWYQNPVSIRRRRTRSF